MKQLRETNQERTNHRTK